MRRFVRGNTSFFLLIGTVSLSAVAFLGLIANPLIDMIKVDMYLNPHNTTIEVGKTFKVDVVVESNIAVNVFAGDIHFDPDKLFVDAIDYNTSIADLWAKLPWYSNGEGVINFAGGTTKPGGFVGQGQLLVVTFKAKEAGNVNLIIDDARILIHDGLGTDATLENPIDTTIAVHDPTKTQEVLNKRDKTNLLVISSPPSTDLNGDGKQSIADISIFMLHLARKNLRSDFNQDGEVTLTDLSILMDTH